LDASSWSYEKSDDVIQNYNINFLWSKLFYCNVYVVEIETVEFLLSSICLHYAYITYTDTTDAARSGKFSSNLKKNHNYASSWSQENPDSVIQNHNLIETEIIL
jgi:hypothetical protein